MHIPADAVCLAPDGDVMKESWQSAVKTYRDILDTDDNKP